MFQVEPERFPDRGAGANFYTVRLRPVHNRPSSCIALSSGQANNQDYIKRATGIYSSDSNWLSLGQRDVTHQHKG
ncbi:hypothetical protein HYQ44_013020 [Verticillium longisporum]|nr:hypothetical protein HYQ44_013020 [Verticillium longisporum]